MKTKKERFHALVSENDDTFLEELENNLKHREMLKESFMIGIKVLAKLDELGWSQKDLAEKMRVTPQQINKIVHGKQNLTLDTIVKLQSALHIPILASYSDYPADVLQVDLDEKNKVKTVITPSNSRSKSGSSAATTR